MRRRVMKKNLLVIIAVLAVAACSREELAPRATDPAKAFKGVIKLDVRDSKADWGPFTPKKARSEEHTSELQSLRHLVCRLLLEKKKQKKRTELTLIANL